MNPVQSPIPSGSERSLGIPNEYKKPLPKATPLTAAFWRASTLHKFVLQKCERCGSYQWYPKPWCIECGSRNLVWTEVSGLGKIYSFTIIEEVVQNSPVFASEIPYVLAEIDLNEGPRMLAQLKDIGPEEARIDMLVKIVFVNATSEISIPQFEKV